jgi:nitronate monooxygenase
MPTVSKTPEMLRAELRRARAEAPGGYVGMNLMAAINHEDFTDLARVSIEEGASFLVQGAGISREIVRWCREAGTPFAGIVSSGRLAAMYEKWGAEFLVAEGAEAGGHIGDIDLPLPSLVEEVLGHTSLPVVAAGGIDGTDVAGILRWELPASSSRRGSSPAAAATLTLPSRRCTSARMTRTSSSSRAASRA